MEKARQQVKIERGRVKLLLEDKHGLAMRNESYKKLLIKQQKQLKEGVTSAKHKLLYNE